MDVVHEVRADGKCLLRDRVEVADDDLGLEADLEQRVRTAVDPDEHRLVLPDVGAQRLQVVAVVVAAHDHERVTALEVGLERWDLERLEQEVRLALDVLQRVDRESLELAADRRARLDHRRFDLGRLADGARGDELVTAPDLALGGDAEDVTLLDPVEHVGADAVDQRHARLEQADRAAVRVAPGDRIVGVDDRADARLDQRVGGDAVDVGVGDERDLTGLEPLDQVLGAAVDPRGSGDVGRGRRPAPESDPHRRPPRREPVDPADP